MLDCCFDQDYICRLRDGDATTQRHFIAHFGDLLSIKLRTRLRSSHLLEEVRQETFLRVLSALHRNGIKQPGRLGAFVNSVCNHVLFEVYRAETHNPNLATLTPEPPDRSPGPEARFAILQRKLLVQRALEALSTRDHRLMRQIFMEDRDKDEICHEFQISREYLRVLVHRAKQQIRPMLQAQLLTS